MAGEIFSTAILCCVVIMIGLGGGFLLLKVQGKD